MRYKVVEDKKYGYFHVMYKKYWFSMWRYARAPRTKYSTYRHVWCWTTRKGAETFIGLQLREQNG